MAKIIKFKDPEKNFVDYVNELTSFCKEDLASINTVILDKLDSDVPLIKEITSYLINSGGKRLRPLFTCCAFQICKSADDENQSYIDLAASVEFIHAATLMHDDVVDESKKRRGQLTSNEIWGNKNELGEIIYHYLKCYDKEKYSVVLCHVYNNEPSFISYQF